MERDIRLRFSPDLPMVDSLWKESLVVSMGFLPTDDRRAVLPKT